MDSAMKTAAIHFFEKEIFEETNNATPRLQAYCSLAVQALKDYNECTDEMVEETDDALDATSCYYVIETIESELQRLRHELNL